MTQHPVTRRSLAKGAAWATPFAVASVAAPAYASSRTVATAYACTLFEGNGDVNYQTFNIFLGASTSDGTPVKQGTVFNYTFTMDATANGTGAPGLPTFTTTGDFAIKVTNVSSTTFTRTFTMQATANSDLPSPKCTNSMLTWDSNGTSPNVMVPNTVVTMNLTGGTVPGNGGTVGQASLSFDVGLRRSSAARPNKAFRFISKGAAPTMFPAVGYAYMSGYNATTGTNGSTCAASGGNNSSTIYPDGTCDFVKISSGNASVPSR